MSGKIAVEKRKVDVNEMAEDIYTEINLLMVDCIKNNRVPYIQENPLPQDMNIVNGKHLGDINKIQLELKAAHIGAKSLKWIYGADAAFIGLELKDDIDTNPVVAFANIKRKTTGTEAQAVYLLDQFTDESLKKALDICLEESPDKQKKNISQNMIRFISEYDSGKNEASLRENKRKNISENTKNPETLKTMNEAMKNISSDYDSAQMLVFSRLNNYYIRQETGLALGKSLTENEKKVLVNNLELLAKVPSSRLAATLTNAFLYSQRMTHYGFSPDFVYTKDDLNKELKVHAPEASKFIPKPSKTRTKDNSIDRIPEREQEIKSPEPTHQLGRRF